MMNGPTQLASSIAPSSVHSTFSPSPSFNSSPRPAQSILSPRPIPMQNTQPMVSLQRQNSTNEASAKPRRAYPSLDATTVFFV
jgi:hypothetical protein